MKVRIGIALGSAGVPGEFAAAVDELERAGVDSLWLPEMVYGPLVEPFIGMAHALSRTAKLKVGTGVSVLPGRHPVLVAKQLASLAGLAPARVLPVFGLRPARRNERDLFAVPPGQRAAVFDESLRLLRRLLREDTVSFSGEFLRSRARASARCPPSHWTSGWAAPLRGRSSGSAGSPTAGWPA
jgi:probable F420-dependent oxidoreductase